MVVRVRSAQRVVNQHFAADSRNEFKDMSDETDTRPQGPRLESGRKFSKRLVDEQLVLKTLSVQPGQTILDAGCGTGYMARVFSDRVASAGLVYALDKDHHFIRSLGDETRGPNIKALLGDPTKLSAIPITYIDFPRKNSTMLET